MKDASNFELPEIRFAPYVQELRELFITRGLHFGNAEDIVRLVQYLDTPNSIHDEMTSMVRSIIFREHEGIPRTSLLALIVVAIGGSDVDRANEEIDQSIDMLRTFVGEVLHSLRRSSFIEEDPASESDTEISEFSSSNEPYAEDASEVLLAAPVEHLHIEDPANWNLQETPDSDTLLRQFSDIKTDAPVPPYFQEPVLAVSAISLPVPTPELQLQTLVESTPAKREPSKLWSIPRRFIWVSAMCLAMFAFFAIFLWHHRTARQLVQTPTNNPSITAAYSATHSVGTEPIHSESASATVPIEQATALNQGDTTPHVTSSKPKSKSEVNKPAAKSAGDSPRKDSVKQPAQASTTPHIPVSAASQTASSNPPAPPKHGPSQSARTAPGRVSPPTTSSPTATQPQPGSFLVSSGVMSDNLVAAPVPSYPKMASMAGVEGQVILQAVISRNGSVVATHVLDGHRLLRGAASNAVRHWHYRPYMVRGKATDVATIVIVDFRLHH